MVFAGDFEPEQLVEQVKKHIVNNENKGDIKRIYPKEIDEVNKEKEIVQMDVNNPINSEDGTILYNVYASDENYTYKGDLLGTYEFGGLDGDRIVGWYHETDVSKYIWYPHFYDLDSCLGVNNSGLLFSSLIK